MLKPFWLAIQFLSRLPSPQYAEVTAKEQGASVNWFPVVGGLIGLLLVFLGQLNYWLPAEVVAGLVLTVWVVSTGALHLDGLADMADGWLGGQGDSERTLAIMKDSAIGTGGGVALITLLLLKWTLLVIVIEQQAWWLLAAAPIVGRIAAINLMPVTTYVSAKGIAEEMFLHLNSTAIWGWFCLLMIAVIWLNIWLFLSLIVVWFWLRWLMIKMTGGMTGDTAGAMTEVIELTWLLGVVALLIN